MGEGRLVTPRAVLVDLNDTLFDGRGLARAVEETCADLAGAGYGPGADRLMAANAAAWKRLWPASEPDWALGRLSGAELGLRGWRETLRACGCDDESAATLAREIHHAYALRALRLYDDVLDFVEALSGRVALGVVPNGAGDDQRERLAWFRLASHFDPIVISAECGLAKPDPAIFHRALEQLGVPAEDVWHVGDSLRSDVAGARAAGVSAVWLNRAGDARPPGAPEPDLDVRSLAEVVAAVGAAR